MPIIDARLESGPGFDTVRDMNSSYKPTAVESLADKPARLTARLAADFGDAIRSKEVSDRLMQGGNDPAPGTPAELRSWMTSQAREWGALATSAGLKVK